MAETDDIEKRALEIWQERELAFFPPRVRRMKPDSIDYASGAWASVVERAKSECNR